MALMMQVARAAEVDVLVTPVFPEKTDNLKKVRGLYSAACPTDIHANHVSYRDG